MLAMSTPFLSKVKILKQYDTLYTGEVGNLPDKAQLYINEYVHLVTMQWLSADLWNVNLALKGNIIIYYLPTLEEFFSDLSKAIV